MCQEVIQDSFSCISAEYCCKSIQLIEALRPQQWLASADPDAVYLPKVEMTWKNDSDNINRWDLMVHVVTPHQLPFDPLITSTETFANAILWVR